MEDWALIRRLAAEGVPKKQIAERLGISRTTVVRAVASTAPPDESDVGDDVVLTVRYRRDVAADSNSGDPVVIPVPSLGGSCSEDLVDPAEPAIAVGKPHVVIARRATCLTSAASVTAGQCLARGQTPPLPRRASRGPVSASPRRWVRSSRGPAASARPSKFVERLGDLRMGIVERHIDLREVRFHSSPIADPRRAEVACPAANAGVCEHQCRPRNHQAPPRPPVTPCSRTSVSVA